MEMIYALSKDMHISYTEFNEMPFFEILMIIDAHNDFVEKQEKESNSDSGEDIISRQQAQMQQMYNQQQAAMPKFDAPKFDMPSMPSFN